jgi:SAM-dependent methyltransferase
MPTDAAARYELFYSSKSYAGEVEALTHFIDKHLQLVGNDLLDVACGTGHHIQYLKSIYTCQGLDINEQYLQIAKQRNPSVPFHLADMIDFDLSARFDIVTCLFSAIGYCRTPDNLNRAVDSMSRHLKQGGLLLVEPWFDTITYKAGLAHAITIEQPGVKACRMNVSAIENGLSVLDFHFLIATEGFGVEYITERHELGLFSADDYMQAFRKSGLKVSYDPTGLTGRGLYIGIKADN